MKVWIVLAILAIVTGIIYETMKGSLSQEWSLIINGVAYGFGFSSGISYIIEKLRK